MVKSNWWLRVAVAVAVGIWMSPQSMANVSAQMGDLRAEHGLAVNPDDDDEDHEHEDHEDHEEGDEHEHPELLKS